MNLTSDTKYLIDRYAQEVGAHLSRKQRADIIIEIRSMLLDTLEIRSEAEEREPDEKMILSILQELGPPYEMAASYNPENYIIGPRLYTNFWATTRLLFVLITLFYLVGLGISLVQSAQSLADIFQIITNYLPQYAGSIFRAFSLLVIIFAILERALPYTDWKTEVQSWPSLAKVPFLRQFFTGFTSHDWDPTTLQTVPKIDLLKYRETIFEMGVIVVAILLFNLLPQWVGIFGIRDGETWFVPLLAPAFKNYLPWWNLYWIFTLGLNLVLISQGRWTRRTRWAQLGLLIFSGAIVLAMLLGESVIGLDPKYLVWHEVSAETLSFAQNTLVPFVTKAVETIFILHLIVKAFVILYRFVNLLRSKPVTGIAVDYPIEKI